MRRVENASIVLITGATITGGACLYTSGKALVLIAIPGMLLTCVGVLLWLRVLIEDSHQRNLDQVNNSEEVRKSEIELDFLRTLKTLDPRQLAMLPAERVIPGSRGPIKVYSLPKGEIPVNIILAYLENSTPYWCCSIRRFQYGSQRQFAQQFERDLIANGLVDPVRVNDRTPLKWKENGYEEACRMWREQ